MLVLKGSPSKEPIRKMDKPVSNDPLHGKTLETILRYLVKVYGWQELGSMIRINCFNNDPGIQSSLKFLRKTPWARKKVEELYIYTISKEQNRPAE